MACGALSSLKKVISDQSKKERINAEFRETLSAQRRAQRGIAVLPECLRIGGFGWRSFHRKSGGFASALKRERPPGEWRALLSSEMVIDV